MRANLQLKDDQLHFINQIIKNLNHLKLVFNNLNDETEKTDIDNLLNIFYIKQEKVMDEINEIHGYPSIYNKL